MTKLSSTQGASATEAPSVASATDGGPAPIVDDALASGLAQVPGSAAQAYSMLSLAANALATAAGSPPQPSPAPTSASQGLQYSGPWIAGAIYGVVPDGPLQVIPDNGERWYAITKGRYIGCTNSTLLADGAVTHVSRALRVGYNSQRDTVSAFNQALALNIGLVEVIAA
ncbi:hypothetical protein C8F04DRAFT_1258981 [Mycena alexandri]|uniref:Uncharacterized protein n=1 Tax=Mycena alexandri TaxID=1745969 RepID=A0AAD6SXD7_9AGAR|nr:hypothetical protein C8F04DRAFT_1258981 [Mycena alexandri]